MSTPHKILTTYSPKFQMHVFHPKLDLPYHFADTLFTLTYKITNAAA